MRTPFSGGKPPSSQPQMVIGIVEVNHDDEAEIGRIKVKFPQLEGEPSSNWARLAAPDAGKNRGMYSVPEKDDEVIVAFLGGDPNQPVVVGQLWNGQDTPPPEAKAGMPGSAKSLVSGGQLSTETFTDGSTSLEGNDRRIWRSRSGHLFVFDDTGGAETIQMWDKGHKLSFAFDSAKNLITLANTEGDIHIRTKNDLTLEAGKNINLRAGQNIATESVQETSMKAGTDLKTEAMANSKHSAVSEYSISAATISFSGSVSTSISGSTSLGISSNGTTTISGNVTSMSGAMVKIN